MNTHKTIRVGLAVLTLLVLATGTVLAWPEQPFAKIDISGPGINGVASITDPDLLAPMTITGFMDFTQTIPEPQNVGAGYELHRYFKHEDGTYWDFDRVRYYPDPSGGRGYVFYEEGIGYGPAHNAGQWFHATPEGDTAMQRILAPVAAPAPTASAAPARAPALTLLAALTGVLLIVWAVQRQAARPRPVESSAD